MFEYGSAKLEMSPYPVSQVKPSNLTKSNHHCN